MLGTRGDYRVPSLEYKYRSISPPPPRPSVSLPSLSLSLPSSPPCLSLPFPLPSQSLAYPPPSLSLPFSLHPLDLFLPLRMANAGCLGRSSGSSLYDEDRVAQRANAVLLDPIGLSCQYPDSRLSRAWPGTLSLALSASPVCSCLARPEKTTHIQKSPEIVLTW